MIDKRSLLFLAGLALGGFFLWLAMREVALDEVASTLGSIDPLWIPLFLALLSVYYVLKLLRWHYLFPKRDTVALARLIEPMMIGFAANNLLPLRAGELLRAWIAGTRLQRSRAEVLATIVIERLLDFLAIAVIVFIGLILSALEESLQGTPWSLLGVFAAVIVASLVALSYLPQMVRLVLPLFDQVVVRLLPERTATRITTIARNFLLGLETVSGSDRRVLILVYSLAQWSLLAGCMLIAFAALEVPELTVPMATTVLGLMVLGVSLPSSPGFVGTIEYAFVLGLGLFGVDNATALASAIFYHGLTFGAVVVAGAVCLVTLRLRADPGTVQLRQLTRLEREHPHK